MSVRIAAGGSAGEAVTRIVPRLVDERIASRLAAQDPELWGPDAVAVAADGLGWTEAVADARPLVAQVEALRERLARDGVDRVVACGAGGASVAAQVIAATQGVPLDVLDSTHPDAVRRVLGDRIASTAAVIVSRSGTTLEADAHRRVFEQGFRDAGVDPTTRIVVVTDAGTPLEAAALEAGYRVFPAPARTGGRYSALTAAALVPAGLAGADLGELLDEAESELLDLAIDAESNNGLVLAAAVAGSNPRRGTLVVVADGTHLVGFGDWLQQLVAGSLGKGGTGLLPVVAERRDPQLSALPDDAQVLRLVDDATDDRHDPLLEAGELLVSGTLGELLLVWEHAVAIAGLLIGVDPFDQPEIDAAEATVRSLLEAADGRPVEVPAAERPDAIERFLAEGGEDGFVGLVLWADPATRPDLASLRPSIAAGTGRPVVLDWGPRSSHATAQLLRDGPAGGTHVVVSAPSADDVPIPGRPYGYAALFAAGVLEDVRALEARGRRVLHVRLEPEDPFPVEASVR